MGWAEERAKLLNLELPVERLPFAPGLPHFVPVGPNRWIETPYAAARCVYDDGPLADGDRLFCERHQELRGRR
jgi:hypothetical protein